MGVDCFILIHSGNVKQSLKVLFLEPADWVQIRIQRYALGQTI